MNCPFCKNAVGICVIEELDHDTSRPLYQVCPACGGIAVVSDVKESIKAAITQAMADDTDEQMTRRKQK